MADHGDPQDHLPPGERTGPSPRIPSPPDPGAYSAAVWDVVRQVPAGKVATYGQIAALIPAPEGVSPEDYAVYRARWAGSAMARAPEGVPWQRIVGAGGKISLSNPRLAAAQRKLLEAEGVAFDPRGRVDLRQHAWAGPERA